MVYFSLSVVSAGNETPVCCVDSENVAQIPPGRPLFAKLPNILFVQELALYSTYRTGTVFSLDDSRVSADLQA